MNEKPASIPALFPIIAKLRHSASTFALNMQSPQAGFAEKSRRQRLRQRQELF